VANIVDEELRPSVRVKGQAGGEEGGEVRDDSGDEEVEAESEEKRGLISIGDDDVEKRADQLRLCRLPLGPRPQVSQPAPTQLHSVDCSMYK